MNIRPLIFAFCTLICAEIAQARTVSCTVTEVRNFSNRIHVRCLEQLTDGNLERAIRFFAAPTGTRIYDDLRDYGTKALDTGLLMVDYDPALNSADEAAHSAIGCNPVNCRIAKSAWLRDRGPYDLNFEASGHQRHALVYPGTSRNGASPVVFFFTGHGGTAAAAAAITRFHVLWPEAIIVYGQGLNQGSHGILRDPSVRLADFPPENHGPGWQIRFPYKARPPVNYTADLDYVDTLYNLIQAREKIDHDRVFAAGYSSGGFFTMSLLQHRPQIFARFAPMAAYSRMHAILRPGRDPVLNSSAFYAEVPQSMINSHISRPVLYAYGKLDFGFDRDGGDTTVSWDPNDPFNSKAGRTLRDMALLSRCNIANVPGTIPNVPRTYLSSDPAGAPILWLPFNDDHNYAKGLSETVVRFFKSEDLTAHDVFNTGDYVSCQP